MEDQGLGVDAGNDHRFLLGDIKEKVVELIIFSLDNEEFAADMDQVREVISIGLITPIPDSPVFIKGITNVRGEIAVIIGLKDRFHMTSKKELEQKHIVIARQGKNLFGVTVDEVTEVLRIQESKIKPPPAFISKIEKEYLRGVITGENRQVILLDLNKILSEDDLAQLSKVSKKQMEAPGISGSEESD